ncbi:glycosyltransferase family 4 protein [Streptococcus porcinus]|uniref:Glycosyltransferase, group 1 family protein n=1 Tax=Streptococcus porcinus str. Jelinkova 176 TaxID=873448 RepID=A0ABN0CUB6_STRPO|nr:glycosyltransferase family 4 protein [Streptococcus porcinus]EGJ26780.1 glycosyltransferase, group 1 family protein [Streptococcus porcinus str. Jelinkova 176]SQG44493.1 putative hexosyltransferase [Streptococcus porcinus]
MTDKKTILFFSGYFLPFLGGIERYTDKLTTELVKLGYDIIIVTTNHDYLPNYEVDNSRKIYRFPSKKQFKQRYPILDKNQEYHDLYNKLLAENADYVICNTRFQLTTLMGLNYAKAKGLPSIVLDHGSSHFTVNNKVLDIFGAIYEHLLTGFVKSYYPQFFAVSERSSEWLEHFSIKSSGVIYNSVPDNLADQFKGASYLPKKEQELYITYAGRILKEKGIAMLVEAFEEANFPKNIHLQIAGDGPLLEELVRVNKNGNIHFLGKLNFQETMSLMAQSDIFVYPSMYPEGLPTSILEAGLLGTAVVATDRGGTTEVITNDQLGIIIEEDKDSLRDALQTLVDDSARRVNLQKNIQERIKSTFVWSVTAKKLEAVLFGN